MMSGFFNFYAQSITMEGLVANFAVGAICSLVARSYYRSINHPPSSSIGNDMLVGGMLLVGTTLIWPITVPASLYFIGKGIYCYATNQPQPTIRDYVPKKADN